MADTVTQQRRSRRFSFASRRQQSNVAPEEGKSHPPVTTIGFPIDDLPLYTESQSQERPGSSWRNAFRRSSSVDRSNSRAPSSERPGSRRLVKKQTGNQSRRDPSVPSETPTLPNVSLISSMSTHIRSRRASLSNNNVRNEDGGSRDNNSKPVQQYKYDRIKANTAIPGSGYAHDNSQGRTPTQEKQKDEQQKASNLPQVENAPTPVNHTLRRVGSPFYHTAAKKAAVIPPSPSALDDERGSESLTTTNTQSWQDESIIPASLRVGRSKVVEPASQSPPRTSLSLQENNESHHSLPRYSPADTVGHQAGQQGGIGANFESISSLIDGYDSIINTPLSSEQAATRRSAPQPSPRNDKSTTSGWDSSNSQEDVVLNRQSKTMSPRPNHAKTPSSSSSSSYSSWSSSGKPSTPVSSNPSTTHLEISSTNMSMYNNAKKEIPRNTMSPKLDKYLAKIFVVCCHCNYWHDIPSGLYAQMVIPECLLFSGLPEPSESRSSRSSSHVRETASRSSAPDSKRHSIVSDKSATSGNSSASSPKATVRCSWCQHEMAKSCCASWTTMVHLIERHN